MSVLDALAIAHAVTPYLVALMTALVSLGFLQVAFYANGVVRYLTMGFLLLYTKVFLRTVYWDLLPTWIAPGPWAAWLEASGGARINVVFHLLVIAACYFSLKAVHRAIPERDRALFSLLTAPFYRFLPNRRAPRTASGERIGAPGRRRGE